MVLPPIKVATLFLDRREYCLVNFVWHIIMFILTFHVNLTWDSMCQTNNWHFPFVSMCLQRARSKLFWFYHVTIHSHAPLNRNKHHMRKGATWNYEFKPTKWYLYLVHNCFMTLGWSSLDGQDEENMKNRRWQWNTSNSHLGRIDLDKHRRYS